MRFFVFLCGFALNMKFTMIQLTLSNLPTDAIMLQSDDTQQQLIQSLWPESTCTFLPAKHRIQSLT